MQIAPGRCLDLADGKSAEVLSPAEPFLRGLVAWRARIDDVELFAVSQDLRDSEGVRARASASVRAVGPRRGARLGADRRTRILGLVEHVAGYRDAASSSVDPDSVVGFFGLTPTVSLARLLTPTTRTAWPHAVVARLGCEIAGVMCETRLRCVDPHSVGFWDEGAWVLDPGLDAMLRPELRERGGLGGATTWLGYLAPEIIRRRTSDVAIDGDLAARHGLGVLLHELLTGQPLYGAHSPLETLVALRRGLPELLSKTVPGIPIDLAACIHALLDHDPLRRPAPALVRATLLPHAAVDLGWTQGLWRPHARPLDHLPHGRR